MGKKTNNKMNIDVWRFIVSFLIVAIHISPFDKISPQFDFFFTRILGRIAVPLFLMITGYYILDKSINDIKRIKEYTKKIIKIYLFCIILYIPINIYMGKFANISFIQIIKDIFINGTLYHLWYFPALILGIWITYFLIKKLGNKRAFAVTIILYLIGLFGDSYYGISEMSGIITNVYNDIFNVCDYTRNGLFLVPIFLYLGYIVKINKESRKYDLYLSIVFFICMTLEGIILHYFNFQRHDSMYIFLIPVMFFLFRYLMSKNKSSNKVLREVATGIYILHPLFIVAVRFISGVLGLYKILVENYLILYVVVSFGTFIFMVFVERAKGLIKNGKH